MSVPYGSVAGSGGSRAVYPGTFDPFTDGHRDLVDRARRLFDEVTVLVAVNDDKRPRRNAAERAASIRAGLPAEWANVTVVAWAGLTAEYCRRVGASVIVRGLRNAGDLLQEQRLAAMNETLGITTMLLPARPELAAMSSSAVRAATSQQSMVLSGSAAFMQGPQTEAGSVPCPARRIKDASAIRGIGTTAD